MYQESSPPLLMSMNATAMTRQRVSEQLWRDAATLFVRWRAGESQAVDDLVRCLSPVLWQIARAQRLDEEAAADVVQSAWLALVRRPESVRDPATVGAWLATTTRREAWRVARNATRVDPTDEELPGPPVSSAEDEATTHLRDQTLWSAVGQLSERCQRLLRVAAFLDRPDYARLSDELGMAVGSIGPTRSRCLTRLRHLLDAVGVHHA
jgi:RNA polymerase sigma factor (sigma-70 family)